MSRKKPSAVEHELVEVFDSIEAFVRDQGADPATALAEDSTELCRYVIETNRVDEALGSLDAITSLGATATVSLDIAGSTVVFTSTAPTAGTWKLTGDLEELGWPDDRDPDAVPSSALVDHWQASGLVSNASVEVLLLKQRWAAPIAQETQTAVWVGPCLIGFADWMNGRSPEATLGILLRDGPALVLLRDWTGQPFDCGVNLIIAGLNFRSTPVSEAARWPDETECWRRRALLVELQQCPAALRPGLSRALAWAAVLLIAEEAGNGEARPDSNATTRWHLRPLPADTPDLLPAVTALARWVSEEPTSTRLAVARRVAGSRMDDPFLPGGASSTVEAATIAYRQTVDSSVRDALAAQLELEQSFRSIDGEFTAVRARLLETLDQTLLRGAAGLVAIAAAATATQQKSSGFVRFGSMLVAAYVLFVATAQLAMARRDVGERLRAFDEVVSGRGSELAKGILGVLERWRTELRSRVRWMRRTLLAVSFTVAAGGLFVANRIDSGGESRPTATTTSTAPSARSTIPTASTSTP